MIGSGKISKMAYPRPPQTGRINNTSVISLSSAVTLFGKPSMRFNANIDSTTDTLQFRRGQSNLFPVSGDDNQGTIEFWFYPTGGTSSSRQLFRIIEVSTSITIWASAGNNVFVRVRFGGTNYNSSGFTYNLNQWNHVAVTLQNNRSMTLWLNGVRRQTLQGPSGETLVTSGGTIYGLWGGRFSNFSYRREFRVSRSVRYNNANSTYQVPAGPFVNDDDTYMLFHLDGTDANLANIPQLIDDVSLFDPDAIAFLSAAGIPDVNTQTAINNLVIDLKNADIWNKMTAIYPFVGATATQHKWNLKDPRDLNAAFRLNFFGGMTHNVNGVTGNGSNAYYQTHINPNTHLLLNDVSGWLYSTIGSTGFDTGTFQGGVGGLQFSGNFDGDFFTRAHQTVSSQESPASPGFFGINRDNGSNYQIWRASSPQTITSASTGKPNSTILGFALGIPGPLLFGNMRHAFAAWGRSLTTGQATSLNNIVQSFQTALNRQV